MLRSGAVLAQLSCEQEEAGHRIYRVLIPWTTATTKNKRTMPPPPPRTRTYSTRTTRTTTTTTLLVTTWSYYCVCWILLLHVLHQEVAPTFAWSTTRTALLPLWTTTTSRTSSRTTSTSTTTRLYNVGGWGIGPQRELTPEEFAKRGERRAFEGYQ